MPLSVYTSPLLALALAVGLAAVGPRCAAEEEGANALWTSTLPGHVVFAAQDGGVSAIYRVAANGTGRVRLFRNDDAVDSDALYPTWTDGGRRIRFTAMRDGVWAGYEMEADGTRPHADGDAEFRLLSVRGSAPDLEVTDDAIWAHDAGGGRHLIHRERPGTSGRVAYANVAWGPDKGYVIFQTCDASERCQVRIARADGTAAFTLADGRHPCWTW